MQKPEISITYIRKYGDEQFGSESIAATFSVTLEDDEIGEAQEIRRYQMASLRNEVLSFLASNASSVRVAQSARREAAALGLDVPEDARNAIRALRAMSNGNSNDMATPDWLDAPMTASAVPSSDLADLEDLPF